MSTHLVGISWCDPEEVAAYKRVGLDGDPRCSTGLFVESATPHQAVSWANRVAVGFMAFLFQKKDYALEALEVSCWVEENPQQSSWKHCLDFLQTVSVGEFPDYHKMTTEAYSEWCEKMGKS